MRKPKKEIHLTSYEELLGIEDNQENSVDKINTDRLFIWL